MERAEPRGYAGFMATSVTARPENLKVLLVEDSLADARLVKDCLSGGGAFTVFHQQHLASALERMEPGAVDAVLLDLGLPDSQGLDTFERIHERQPETPIVLLTGLDDETVALKALERGAQDYVVKGGFDRESLPRVLRYAVERNRAEARARRGEDERHGELDRRKDGMIADVSHALRNPITVVLGAIADLSDARHGALSPDQAELASMASRNAVRLSRIVENLLNLSRLESGKSGFSGRRLPLEPELRDALARFEALAKAKNIHLALELPPALPEVWADPELVAEVLDNLLDNALRFAARRVVLRASRDPARKPPGGGGVVVEVFNDGEPIPADRLPELFDRFVQLSRPRTPGYKGTGLGLAICQEIAVLHGTSMRVTSSIEAGTSFSLSLSERSAL